MAKGKYEEWLKPEGLLRIEGWARDGLSEEQIAHNMGVAYSTLRDWKEKYSALSTVLKNSKEVADRIVENALYRRAIGTHEKIKKPIKVKEIIYDEITGKKLEEREVIKYVEEDLYVTPDVTAQIFWLKNRKPQDWRDRKDVNVDGTINDPFKGLTTAELKKLVGDTVDK